MAHPIYRVRSFQVEGPYTLRVRFDDESEQVIDFRPVLAGEMYRPLRDLAAFNRVRIDPEVHTLGLGRTGRILTRRRFTIGLSMSRH